MVFENYYASRQDQQRKQIATSYKIYEAISRSKEKSTDHFNLQRKLLMHYGLQERHRLRHLEDQRKEAFRQSLALARKK